CKAVTSYRRAPAPVRRPASVSSGGGSTVPASAPANPPATFMGGAGAGAGASAPAATPTPGTSGVPPRRRQQGQVYAHLDDGVRHYTSQPPRGGGASAVRTIRYSFFETCYACAPLPGVNFGTVRLNTTAYAAEIREAATRFGVEEAIVRA